MTFDVPRGDSELGSPAEAAVAVIAAIYLIAALINLHIIDTGARYPHQERNPARLIIDFAGCFMKLWRDRLGQISLAVTTLFWGAGAVLQFVILRWSSQALGLDLSHGAILQAVVSIGIGLGAVLAASRITLARTLSVLPCGVAMGAMVIALAFFQRDSIPHVSVHVLGMPVHVKLLFASLLLASTGALAGYFVVPMNALLQHRGHVLMSAGHSIAVQNFNENLSVLTMLCVYAMLVHLDLSIRTVMVLFGVFVCAVMLLVIRHHQHNERRFATPALVSDTRN